MLKILEQSIIVTKRNINKPYRDVILLDLVFKMQHKKATNQKDMLFVLRSIVLNKTKKHFIIDYSKLVNNLYTNFYKEVKRVYIKEIKFVKISEKERLEKVKKVKRNYIISK